MKKFFPILLLLMAGSAANAGGLSTRHQTSLQFINDGGHTEYTRMGASYSISGTNASTTHTVGNNDPVTGGLGVQSYAANGVATPGTITNAHVTTLTGTNLAGSSATSQFVSEITAF